MTTDADPFDPAAIAPETAAFNERLEADLAALPKPYEIDVALTRRLREEGKSYFPRLGPAEGSDWIGIGSGEGPGRRVRVSEPDGTPRGTYLHIHGGGWTFNAPHHYDLQNQRVARETGARVFSAEYRLAPEHRWPAQGEDCLAAARWALATQTGPVVIGGESAGAHLALVTALALRDLGAGDRLAGIVLNYGVFDLRGTPSVRNWGERWLILSTPIIGWFTENLLGGQGADVPAVSPLLADLAGLPPVLLQVGTADPLLDDSLFLAARLRAARVPHEIAVVPGAVHAFDNFDLAIAREGFARQDGFVARCLGAG